MLASFIRIAKKKKLAGVLCLAARTMIYTGDAVAAPNMILTKARDWYNVNRISATASGSVSIYPYNRRIVNAYFYPHFTMLGQSLGSLVLMLFNI